MVWKQFSVQCVAAEQVKELLTLMGLNVLTDALVDLGNSVLEISVEQLVELLIVFDLLILAAPPTWIPGPISNGADKKPTKQFPERIVLSNLLSCRSSLRSCCSEML